MMEYWKENVIRWFGLIGFRTRAIVREVLEEDPRLFTYLWVGLFGLCFFMVQADLQEFGNVAPLSVVLGYGLILGPLFGFLYWLLSCATFWGMGRLIGGRSTWKEMMTAVAWAYIPYFGKLILLLFQFLLFGEELFTSYTPRMDEIGLLKLFYLFFVLLETLLTVWFYLVLIRSVAEAHEFAWWKAGGVVVVGVLVIAFVLLIGFRILIFPV